MAMLNVPPGVVRPSDMPAIHDNCGRSYTFRRNDFSSLPSFLKTPMNRRRVAKNYEASQTVAVGQFYNTAAAAVTQESL